MYDSLQILLLYLTSYGAHISILEYNIIFPTIEKTGQKTCYIREQIIGIAMVSESDFDNMTGVWSCGVYTL